MKRCGELPGAVADQEPEVGGAVTEIDQEITDLLGGPRPIRVRGDRQNAIVAAAGFGCARRQRLQEGLSGSCYSCSLWPASGVSEVGEHCQDPPVAVGGR